MSINLPFGALKALTDRLKDREKEIGYHDSFRGYLGKGDGKGTITNPTAKPPRQAWYYTTDSHGAIIVVASATMLDNAGFVYEDDSVSGVTQEGQAVQIGYAPKALNQPGLVIYGRAGHEGAVHGGPNTPIEKQIAQAGTPQLIVAAVDGSVIQKQVTLMLFPAGSLVAQAPNTVSVTFPTSSTGTNPVFANKVIYKCGSAHVYTPAVGTTAIINYDTLVQDAASLVTTGAAWHFTAPVAADYTVILTGTLTASGVIPTIFALEVYVNGLVRSWDLTSASQGFPLTIASTYTVHLNIGDTLNAVIVPGVTNTGSPTATVAINSQLEIDWVYTPPAQGGLQQLIIACAGAANTTSTTTLCVLPNLHTISQYIIKRTDATAAILSKIAIGVSGGTLTACLDYTVTDFSIPDTAFIGAPYTNNSGSSQTIVATVVNGDATLATPYSVILDVL